jgi:hypothetical protein
VLLTRPAQPNRHRTPQALNWYSSVREKLDNPLYSSWFIKFSGFNNTQYPGGQGLAQNNSFHVPACDWYNNGTAPRCSGFYREITCATLRRLQHGRSLSPASHCPAPQTTRSRLPSTREGAPPTPSTASATRSATAGRRTPVANIYSTTAAGLSKGARSATGFCKFLASHGASAAALAPSAPHRPRPRFTLPGTST